MMRYKVQRVTDPAVEPVTLARAKEQLRIESGFTDDDDLIQAYIGSARDQAEKYCNRSFARADFFLLINEFPNSDDPLHLPDPVTSAVSEISYIDENNVEQTVTGFTLDTDRQQIRPDDAWPVPASGVKIKYTAGPDGSASPPETAPASVVQGMLLIITDMYEMRTTQVRGTIVTQNPAATMRLSLHRVEMGV